MSKFIRNKGEDMTRKSSSLEEANLQKVVPIKAVENKTLVEELDLSVIARILNPTALRPLGLAVALPKIWDVEQYVKARVIGQDRVQFIFKYDYDLNRVLEKGPWFVNGWMVTGEKWTTKPSPHYLNRILFWVNIRNIPLNYISEETVRNVGATIGEVTEEIQLHGRSPSSMEYVRARIWLSVDKPIIFKIPVSLNDGEPTMIDFEYEKLQKMCLRCKRLTHDQFNCPYRSPSSTTCSMQQPKEKGVLIKEPQHSSISSRAQDKLIKGKHHLGSSTQLPQPTKRRESRRKEQSNREIIPSKSKGKGKQISEWRPKNVDPYKVATSRKHLFVTDGHDNSVHMEKSSHNGPRTPPHSPKEDGEIPSSQNKSSGASTQKQGKKSDDEGSVLPPALAGSDQWSAERPTNYQTMERKSAEKNSAEKCASVFQRITSQRSPQSQSISDQRTSIIHRLEIPSLQASEKRLSSGKIVGDQSSSSSQNPPLRKRKSSAERNQARKRAKLLEKQDNPQESALRVSVTTGTSDFPLETAVDLRQTLGSAKENNASASQRTPVLKRLVVIQKPPSSL